MSSINEENKVAISLETMVFFTSPRVNEYLRRLKICSILIIVFSLIQTISWLKLNFIEINFSNSILVFSTNCFLFISNIATLIALCLFTKMVDHSIMKKIDILFYFSFFSFFINMVQTLSTLFESFLAYFENISLTYSSSIGINLTFLIIFTIFLIIVINTCLSVYFFLMSSKFHTYVKLSANFGIFNHYTAVSKSTNSSQNSRKTSSELAMDITSSPKKCLTESPLPEQIEISNQFNLEVKS